MTIVRKINEAIMLINLLSYEYYSGKDKFINKWFSGDLVMHGECRDGLEKMSKEFDTGVGVDMSALESYLYQMTSQPAHNGYVTILENISPFNEGLDFEGSTGLHRTISGIDYLRGEITEFANSLKMVYIFVLKDPKGFDEIQKIYISHWGKGDIDSISEEVINDFKKNNHEI